MTVLKDFKQLPAPIAALESVALIDGPTSAAVGQMGLSWWLAQVAAGRAPAPVVRRPRCTRWRVSDVSKFWSDFAAQADSAAADAVVANAKRASLKASEARKAGTGVTSTWTAASARLEG